MQPQAKYLHILPYWLGALIRTLASDSADTASMALSPLLWFLWHFTAAAVPEYLRQPLVDAQRAVAATTDGRGYTSTPVRARAHATLSVKVDNDALGWVLATDRATAALCAGARLPAGDALYTLQADLLNRVRPPP